MGTHKNPIVRRGKDELDFMKSRADSTPLSEAVAHAELAQLRSRLDSLERHEGLELHELGTTLLKLYMRHADATLGYRSYRAFLEAEFAGDPRRAFEAMTVARATTAAIAAEKGARWVLRAWAWARLAGHEDLTRAGRLTVEVRGQSVRLLDTTVRQLDEAIGRAGQPQLAEPAGRQLDKARRRVGELVRADGEVAALAPSLFLDQGKLRVRTTASDPGDLAALKRVLRATYGR